MTTTTLHEALLAFQLTLPTVGKDNKATVPTKTGGSYTYKYADLTTITEIALPLLLAQGLTWTTRPTVLGGEAVLSYSLTHSSGDSIDGDYPLGAANQAPQVLGSAITYARRYALCAVTGIAPTGDDDDGKAASTPAPKTPTKSPVAAVTPPLGWRDLLAEVGSLEALQALYDTEAHKWFTDEVKLAFKARKAQL